MPPSSTDDPGEPHSDTESEDSDDPLLLEAAEALEPTAPAESPPGRAGAAPMYEPRSPARTAGTLIAGRYRLDHLLGEGGRGEVWAATHAITRRQVARKFLKGPASMRSEMRQRFLREARAVSLVQHPSVVEVLDVFEIEGGVPVMVMDLLIGETLRARLARDGVLPAVDARPPPLPAVVALVAAHAT